MPTQHCWSSDYCWMRTLRYQWRNYILWSPNTHWSILTTTSCRNIPSESLERFNFTTSSRVNLAGFLSSSKKKKKTCQFCRSLDISAIERKTKLDITCHWHVLSPGWQPLAEAGLRAVSHARRISGISPQLCSGNRNKSALLWGGPSAHYPHQWKLLNVITYANYRASNWEVWGTAGCNLKALTCFPSN